MIWFWYEKNGRYGLFWLTGDIAWICFMERQNPVFHFILSSFIFFWNKNEGRKNNWKNKGKSTWLVWWRADHFNLHPSIRSEPHGRCSDWQYWKEPVPGASEHRYTMDLQIQDREDFDNKYGHLRVKVKEDFDGVRLGIWSHKQRNDYRKGLLSDEQIRLLENIDMIWRSEDSLQRLKDH